MGSQSFRQPDVLYVVFPSSPCCYFGEPPWLVVDVCSLAFLRVFDRASYCLEVGLSVQHVHQQQRLQAQRYDGEGIRVRVVEKEPD